MDLKIIKTEKEYEDALDRLHALMNAEPGSPQEDELDLLSLLIEKYEKEHYPIEPPDPIDAILFRMDQQGLTARDMIQYIGSQSKVSEVLNRKRPLSLAMIRNLNTGLGIPLEVLMQPVVGGQPGAAVAAVGGMDQAALYYNCDHLRQPPQQDAIKKWLTQVIDRASNQKILAPWGSLDSSIFDELLRLGSYSAGPKMACELLNKKGILVIIQKLPAGADLDGACYITPQKNPVIGLTLRSKRLDQFWLTLFHLLAHLYLHQGEKPGAYFDSLECVFDQAAPAEEQRANEIVKEVFLSSEYLQKAIRSCQQAHNPRALKAALQTCDTSPEMISCWAQLKQEDAAAYVIDLPSRKVSEKLEVYG
jgi:HTH-type transcriptional regulator/antitoxin HigA